MIAKRLSLILTGQKFTFSIGRRGVAKEKISFFGPKFFYDSDRIYRKH